jgi:hypothetical protein
MRWAGHIAYMEKCLQILQCEIMKIIENLGNTGIDRRIILKWILKKRV